MALEAEPYLQDTLHFFRVERTQILPGKVNEYLSFQVGQGGEGKV